MNQYAVIAIPLRAVGGFVLKTVHANDHLFVCC